MYRCPKCKKELTERPTSILNLNIYVCNDCKQSFSLSLVKKCSPSSTMGRSLVERFKRMFDDMEGLRSQANFNVLVWGPSTKKNNGLSRKRIDIKEALIADGHDAKFSEELEEAFSSEGRTIKQNELLQVKMFAQLVVIILGKKTFGSLGEMHDFATAIKNRGLIFVPKGIENSYTQGVLSQLDIQGSKIEIYDDNEIEICVLKTVTEEWVASRREKQIAHLIMAKDHTNEII